MTLTSTSRALNFSAGPAVLPLPVLEQIQAELLSLPGVGSSVLEISHRSPAFDAILEDATSRIRKLMNISDDYEVLYLQGGARLQNAMIPMNLLTDSGQTADYVLTGAWGKKSAEEVARFGKMNVAWDGSDSAYNSVPTADQLTLTDGAAYVHYTSNETIQGVQFSETPDCGSAPLVCDQSSDILCRNIDVSKYGLVYACAQKNIGVAGVTMVIVKKELLERAGNRLAGYLSYANHSKGGSRYNTPPTFSIYVLGLVAKWIEESGGVDQIHQNNIAKSKMLYDIIDGSNGFYIGHAEENCRSIMNVVFKMATPELDQQFASEADENGMTTLKGHRSVGGIRASIYNAMPIEGVEKLATFMKDFANKNA